MRLISSPLLIATIIAAPHSAPAQIQINTPDWSVTRLWSTDVSAQAGALALASKAVVDGRDRLVLPLVASRRVVFLDTNGDVTGFVDGLGRISALGFLGDTLWTADGTSDSFRMFARSGAQWSAIGSRSYREFFGSGYNGDDLTSMHWVPVGLMHDRRIVALLGPSLASRSLWRPSSERATVLLRSARTGQTDTLGHLNTTRATMRIRTENGDRQIPNPLRYRDLIAVDDFGQLVTLVNFPPEGDTSALARMVTISTWNARGVRTFRRSFPSQLRTITAAALDSSPPTVVATDAQGNATLSITQLRAGILEANPPGSKYVPVSQLVVGRDSTIWLKENATGVATWLVLSSTGNPLARARFPVSRSATLLAADSRSAWFFEREGGRASVVRFRISHARPNNSAP